MRRRPEKARRTARRRSPSSVISMRKGDTVIYPPVDMVFECGLNMMDYQIARPELPQFFFLPRTCWKVEALAIAGSQRTGKALGALL